MKVNTRALAATSSLLWGGAVLGVGVVNSIWPNYGAGFLQAIASVYPGFHPDRKPRDLALGTAYALLDGAGWGLLFGVVYNSFVPDPESNRSR
ncbi:MAG TPA: hypothetical protein VGG15_03070 [Terriglobales bacterium]